MSKIYDVIILGAGPAGLAAGLYAGRSRLSTLIIEKGQDLSLIHIFPAGAAYDGRKARYLVDAGIHDGSGRSGICKGKPETSGIKGNYRNAGKFPGII